MKQGVLFIGHGTRVQAGLSEFEMFVKLVINQISQNLHTTDDINRYKKQDLWFGSCFLELQEPNVPQGIEAAVLNECDKVLVVPIFLFSAKHIRTDIPHFLEIAGNQFTDVVISQTPPFGPDKSLVDACSYRLIEGGWTPDIEHSCIILVGRGGNDLQARLQFETFSSHMATYLNVRISIVKQAFLAGKGPSVSDVLAQCLREGFRNVYVVPVLLFRGKLTIELGSLVRSWNQLTMWSGMAVVLVDHLQNHAALIRRLTEKVSSAITTVPVVQ